jgi:hypothetical protein
MTTTNAVCGAETAGFKPTGFEPQPRQKTARLSLCDKWRGWGATPPTTGAIMDGSAYQAGVHENCPHQHSHVTSQNNLLNTLYPDSIIWLRILLQTQT